MKGLLTERESRVYESPSKKLRSSPSEKLPGEAFQFTISPLLLKSKQDAIALKRRDPEKVAIRSISVNPLSIRDAENHESASHQLCVSPLKQQTNYKQTRILMYMDLIGTTPAMCGADLNFFLLKILDHNLKFQIRNSQGGLISKLVGVKGKRPFQASNGNNIRYSTLLLFYNRLKHDDDGNVMEDKDMLIEDYDELLFMAEHQAIMLLDKDIPLKEETKKDMHAAIRKEVTDFFKSEKAQRDIRAHMFTDLFWTEIHKPLDQQEALDQVGFPGQHFDAFNLVEESRLHALGLKMLVLEDLKTRGIGCLTPNVTKMAIYLAEAFVKANVERSREVFYGTLRTLIPGQISHSETEAAVVFDENPRTLF